MEWLKGIFFGESKESESCSSYDMEQSERSQSNYRQKNLQRDFNPNMGCSNFAKGSNNKDHYYDNTDQKSTYSKRSNLHDRIRDDRSEKHYRSRNVDTTEKMSVRSGKNSIHKSKDYSKKYDYEKMWKNKMNKDRSCSRSRSRSPIAENYDKKSTYSHKNYDHRHEGESRSRRSESKGRYSQKYEKDRRSEKVRDSYENRYEDSRSRQHYDHEKQRNHNRDPHEKNYNDEDCRKSRQDYNSSKKDRHEQKYFDETRSKNRDDHNIRTERDEGYKNKDRHRKVKDSKKDKERQRKISVSSDSDDSSDSLDLNESRSYSTNQISNQGTRNNNILPLTQSGMLNTSFEMPPQSLEVNKMAMSPNIGTNFRPGNNVNQLAMTPQTRPMDSPMHKSIMLESPMHQSMISGESPIHPSMGVSLESPMHPSMRENLFQDSATNPVIESQINMPFDQNLIREGYSNNQMGTNNNMHNLETSQNQNINQIFENQSHSDQNQYMYQQTGNVNNQILNRPEIDQRPSRFDVPMSLPNRSNNNYGQQTNNINQQNSNNQPYNYMNQPGMDIRKISSYSNMSSGLQSPNPEKIANRNMLDTISQSSRGESVLRASMESKFTQKSREVTNVGARPRCFNCGEWGHTNRECTKAHYNKIIFSTVNNPEKFKDLPRKKAATNKNYLKRNCDKLVVDYIRFGKNEFPSQAEIARENEQKFAEYTSEFDQKEMVKYLTMEGQDLKQTSNADTFENFMDEVNQP